VFHNIKIKTIDLQRLVKMPAALFFEIHSGNEFFFAILKIFSIWPYFLLLITMDLKVPEIKQMEESQCL